MMISSVSTESPGNDGKVSADLTTKENSVKESKSIDETAAVNSADVVIDSQFAAVMGLFLKNRELIMPGAFFDDIRDYLNKKRLSSGLEVEGAAQREAVGKGATGQVFSLRSKVNQSEQDLVCKTSIEALYDVKKNRMNCGAFTMLRELHFFEMISKRSHGLYKQHIVEYFGASLSNDYRLKLYLEKCQYSLIHYIQCGLKTVSDMQKITQGLLAAVAFLHVNGVVHRDIKLENILIQHGENGLEAKLCDFGTTFEMGLSLDVIQKELDQTLITTTNVYIAPEFFQQDELRDLYLEYGKRILCHKLVYNHLYGSDNYYRDKIAVADKLGASQKEGLLKKLMLGIDIFATGLVLMELFHSSYQSTQETLMACLDCLVYCLKPIESRSLNVNTYPLFSLFSRSTFRDVAELRKGLVDLKV